MKCPKCNIEAAISGTRYVATGDNSPDEETKLFIEQRFSCRNRQCANFGKEIGLKKNQLGLEKDEGETP